VSTQTYEDLDLGSSTWTKLDAVMQSYVDQGKVAGMSYLIQQGNELVHSAARGVMDVDAGKPMQTDTIFRIASMTKPVTAVGVMMLVEAGLLSLDDPVSRFIPEFDAFQVLVDPSKPSGERENLARAITVRHLLANTSGLAYGILDDAPIESVYREAGLGDVSLEEMVARLVKLPLEFQPSTGWRYCIGFDVLGYVVELASGMAFDRYLDERIFRPLGMVDTGFVVPETEACRLSALYSNPDEGEVILYDDPSSGFFTRLGCQLSGGSGLVSTVSDYLKFMRLLRNAGEYEGTRLLKPETLAMMVTNQLPSTYLPINVGGFALEGTGYGLGFGVCVEQAEWMGGLSEGSYFWMGGYGTHAWVDPKRDLIGVLMIQNTWYPEPAMVFQSLVYQALD